MRPLFAITLVLGGVISLLPGCGRHDDPLASAAPRAPEPARRSDLVTIPPDSPQAKQMRIDQVHTADMPIDEVLAPGKIIINPNRTSKLLLPVAGRIVSVTAQLGDTVAQGQPLVAVESPDADTAVAAYQQAQATE